MYKTIFDIESEASTSVYDFTTTHHMTPQDWAKKKGITIAPVRMVPGTVFDSVRERLISVDTEFMTVGDMDDASKIERETGIKKVFCACFSADYAQDLRIWIDQSAPYRYTEILDHAAEYFGIEDPIFLSYSMEAEWSAFKRLRCNPFQHQWLDAFVLYRLVKNVQGKSNERLGLVDAIEDMLGVKRNRALKDAMRDLCIQDKTDGREQEILEYCAEDVRDLIDLTEKLWERLENRFECTVKKPAKTMAITPRIKGKDRMERWESFASQVEGLMDSAKAFAKIAERGLPVDVERCDAIRKGAAAIRDKMVREFVEKYPGAFVLDDGGTKMLNKYVNLEAQETLMTSETVDDALAKLDTLSLSFGKVAERTRATIRKQLAEKYELRSIEGADGKWKRCDKVCREYLEKCLREKGLLKEWDKTPSGELSMDQESLKAFKLSDHNYEPGFGGDFARLTSKVTALNGLMKKGADNWLSNLDRTDARIRYRSLRPFTSKTGRCQPQTSKGFVPGWDKSLQCVLNPPKGKWLVELDYSAEETFIPSRVYSDKRYAEVYASKDTYLWMGTELGLIPRNDYETMSKSELKAKYHDLRSRLKTFTLAIGYGAGVSTLSSKVGLPQAQVKKMYEMVRTTVFPQTYASRDYIEGRIKKGGVRCLWLQNGWHTVIPNDTRDLNTMSLLNFPIQGTGSIILHRLVCELENACIETVATVHDAVWILVDAGDMETVALARMIMERTANYVLGVPMGESGIRVGEPEIIKHGDLWTAEHAYDDAAREILRAGGYVCA